ncbi:response regulator, partial [Desulfobulbus sp. US2]|nr:response regulator [Desulfobulbus sp. US2]
VKNHLQLYRMQEHLEDVVNERTQELKESEQQLQRARKMEAIGRLAGGIAHDFNNILSAILGFAELIIITKSSDSEVTEYAQQVITATNRAAHLVKQILSYSNKSNVTKELFQPHFVVEEAMKLLRTTLPKTLTIVEDIDPKSGSILANPMNIHQVVVNLCTNASQAMYKGKGTLSVALYKEKIDNTVIPADQQAEPGEYVTLSIRDTGCSIPEEDFENMFEPYFNTMKSRGSRGMGLAVVQSITWDSNGFIRVASQADQGTVITVSFPAKETPSEKNIPLDKEKSGGVISDSKENNSKEKILVVDDEELLIQINRKRLEQAGYTVEAFTDSNKALEIFRARPNSFNLLITDQTMPGLSGKELVKAVLEVKPSMPIIMCTGHSDSVSEKKALSMGIRKYITKPLHQHELREAVKELLASKPFSVDGI